MPSTSAAARRTLKPLDRELETFERHREQLQGTSLGKYVLIHDDTVAGVFDSESDAISQGYRQFGNVAFLVKEVVLVDIVSNFVSSQLGL